MRHHNKDDRKVVGRAWKPTAVYTHFHDHKRDDSISDKVLCDAVDYADQQQLKYDQSQLVAV